MSTEQDDQRRILKEILDPVDVNEEAPGPEGPWRWKSLKVRRIMNKIVVFDVDGSLYDVLHVPDMTDHDYPKAALKRELNRIHEDSLDEL